MVGIRPGDLIMIASWDVPLETPKSLAKATPLSHLSVTMIATIVGTIVPIILDKFGCDPAMAVGVLITSTNGAHGVLVFFPTATAFSRG